MANKTTVKKTANKTAAKLAYFPPRQLIEERVRVWLVGAGGNGAEMLDNLARMDRALRALGHPGFHVKVWDGDSVSATNLVRQRFLPGDEGQNKAVTLVQRYNLFFGLDWDAQPAHFSAAAFQPNDHGPAERCDLLATCVDKAKVRVAVGKAMHGRHSETLWLDLGNDAYDGQVVLGHLGRCHRDGLRLPNVYDLYPEMAELAASLDRQGASCSAEESLARQEFPVNRTAATAGATLLWNLLRHGRLEHHGVFFDVRAGRMTPLPIDPVAWQFMGYVAPT